MWDPLVLSFKPRVAVRLLMTRVENLYYLQITSWYVIFKSSKSVHLKKKKQLNFILHLNFILMFRVNNQVYVYNIREFLIVESFSPKTKFLRKVFQISPCRKVAKLTTTHEIAPSK